MKLFVFLLASIISAAVAGTYNGYETPDYTVLEENDGYELRSYGVTKWAATSMNAAVFWAGTVQHVLETFWIHWRCKQRQHENQDDFSCYHQIFNKIMCFLSQYIYNDVFYVSF